MLALAATLLAPSSPLKHYLTSSTTSNAKLCGHIELNQAYDNIMARKLRQYVFTLPSSLIMVPDSAAAILIIVNFSFIS